MAEGTNYEVVKFTSVSGALVMATSIVDESVTLGMTGEEAVAAVARFLDGQKAAAEKRSSRKQKKQGKVAGKGKGGGKGRKADTGPSVEFHFLHDFAPKSRMPSAGSYRCGVHARGGGGGV